VIERIKTLRDELQAQGVTRGLYPRIARILTEEGIPTAKGNTVWGESSVRSALRVNPTPPPKKPKKDRQPVDRRAVA
jgi:hypothetical protein